MALHGSFHARLSMTALVLSAFIHLGCVVALPSLGEPGTVVAVDHAIPIAAAVAVVVSVVAALVSTLKVPDNSPKSGPLLTGWDNNQLRQVRLPSSPLYDSSVCLSTLFQSIFPTDEWWSSKDMLCSAAKDSARVAGFFPCTNHNYIRCNHFESQNTIHNFSCNPLRENCTLTFYLKTMYYIPCPSECVLGSNITGVVLL